jgi:sphingomyelin phosphodiesterase acid-like 3
MSPRSSAAILTAATLLATGALAGCSSSDTAPTRTVVAFSDVHFDPFFDPALVAQLDARPESEWASIFATSGITGPGGYGDRTNAVLLRESLAALGAQQPPPALVIFGGDFLVQGYQDMYYAWARAHDEPAMRAFALKAVTYVVHQARAALGSTPVYFTLGNWDNYSKSFGLQPADPFLADTADLFLDGLLAGTGDREAFQATYRAGGYYAAAVPGTNLVVIGLNDLFLTPQAPAGIEWAAQRELDWLDATLTSVQFSGQRAWIVAHVPPGGDLVTTADDLEPQEPLAQATMLLVPRLQDRFLAILAARGPVVEGVFTGHTHMDEYRIGTVDMQGVPGITSDMGNAPAFKTFTVSSTWTLQDYVSWTMDLSAASPSFQAWYDFSTAYGLPAPLGPSQVALVPQLATSATAQAGYRARYGSGNTPTKAITDLNWPVYRCGVSFLTQRGLTDCVNQQ